MYACSTTTTNECSISDAIASWTKCAVCAVVRSVSNEGEKAMVFAIQSLLSLHLRSCRLSDDQSDSSPLTTLKP